MNKCRYAIIGTGWRAEFFMRIALADKEKFELTSVYTRSEEKADELSSRWGVKTTTDFEQMLEDKPNFVVLCVNRNATMDYFEKLIKIGMPILCETPPAQTNEQLYKLYDLAKEFDAKIQIAEQYHRQPLYAAWYEMVKSGMIGEVSNMSISALHGYHAVSIFRQFLNAQMDEVKISGRRFSFPVKDTDSRAGLIKDGEIKMKNRELATFEFSNGAVGFFNFSDSQYHSVIRTRHVNIQGKTGEIDDMQIRYLNEDGDGVLSNMIRTNRGEYNNLNWDLQDISLNGKVIYKNPFSTARLNDDEIAIAACTFGMQQYLDTGKQMYSLEDGLQDSIISNALYQALETGETITVPKQPWAETEV